MIHLYHTCTLYTFDDIVCVCLMKPADHFIHTLQGFFQQFWEKAPGQNLEKIIDLTSNLGEIYDRTYNKGSKIYSQNQVILDCIMSSIPLKAA